MPLTSKLFTADPAAVHKRLELCLVKDPDHFLPGSKGPEVARIQKALSTLGSVKIAQHEIDDQSYGDTTAAAVTAFKRQWNILNYEKKLDPIVGIKTLGKLDAMMADWEKHHAPPTPPPPPPVVGAAGVQIGPLGARRRIIESYYRNCGLETVGPGQITTGAIQNFSTFDELLDVLLARNEAQQVIVNHGSQASGLIIPFAKGSPFTATGQVAGELAILADQEEQGVLDPNGFGVVNTSARMGVQPAVTVGMVRKLVSIRKKKLILHFRACTIGGNRGSLRDYKDAFGAAMITFHSCRLLFVVISPDQTKPGQTAAGEFAKHQSGTRKRYRLFEDPIGLLWPMVVGILDKDGHTNVESGSLIELRTVEQIQGWAEFLVRQWRQGGSTEFVVPVMWENSELTYHCPLEPGWRSKIESV